MTAILSVKDAGRVALGEQPGPEHEMELRLLHAGPYSRGRHAISRSVSAVGAKDGLQMPAGATVAGLWNRERARYVAISRPFDVPAGTTVDAPLEYPRGVAHLVVQLVPGDGDARLILKVSGKEIEPDALIRTAGVVYGLWYDLPGGKATLQAGSEDSYLEPRSLILQEGRVHRFVGELIPSPLQAGE